MGFAFLLEAAALGCACSSHLVICRLRGLIAVPFVKGGLVGRLVAKEIYLGIGQHRPCLAPIVGPRLILIRSVRVD